MEAGTIVRWLKSEGDQVAKGEPLYELDTDKVTQEVEAEADGVLLKIVVPEGEVDVGTTVAVIGAEGEEVAVEAPSTPSGERRAARRGEAAEAPADGDDEPSAASDESTGGERCGRGAPSAPADAEPRARRASASRHRRSRAGSRASAASTSRR